MTAKKYFSDEERKAAKALSAKKYRERHPERVKAGYQRWKKANPEHIGEYRRTRRNSVSGYIDRFLERAKISTTDTDLDREFFEGRMDVCAVTGYEFSYYNLYGAVQDPTCPSIDRIDSKRGYYKDNVQVILCCLNRFKGDLPNDDFLKLWEALTSE